MHILLVDDDFLLRAMLSNIIENLGHSVIMISSGTEALEHLSKSTEASFDAIITDMQMPGITGAELIHELSVQGMNIPCLLHSSDDFGKIPGIGYTELCTISKPFPFARFSSKLKRGYIQSFLSDIQQKE